MHWGYLHESLQINKKQCLITTWASRHRWRFNGGRLVLLTLLTTACANAKANDNANNPSLTSPLNGPCCDQAPKAFFLNPGLAGFDWPGPHGGRPSEGLDRGIWKFVSIHAPAWRATRETGVATAPVHVSIHAPAWRATWAGLATAHHQNVSIHAPAWRATGIGGKRGICPRSFNPRPRMEGDPILWGQESSPRLFQSTPPHGGRRGQDWQPHITKMFQSTPPHGGRPAGTHTKIGTYTLFQSTPPHGGRQLPTGGVPPGPLCTPGMGVNLWGASPLYVNPVNKVTVNTSISRKQGRNREEPSEGSWSAKL